MSRHLWWRPRASWPRFGGSPSKRWLRLHFRTLSAYVCATLDSSMGLGKLGQAFTAKEIFDLVKADLRLVEEEIARESVSSVEAITTIGRYLQSSGGKRLRPSLLLLSAKVIGDGGISAVRLGAVVEVIHAATLVHDDEIEAADIRRGRPSTDAQWGKHTSVL